METYLLLSVVWFELEEISDLIDLSEFLEILDVKWGNQLISDL